MPEPSTETRVALLEQAVEQIVGNVDEIKDATNRIADAMETIARLEERQLAMSSGLERANGDIGNLYGRVHAIEMKQPENASTNQWVREVIRVVLIGVVAAGVATAVGGARSPAAAKSTAPVVQR